MTGNIFDMDHNEKTYKRFLMKNFRLLPEESHKGQNGRVMIIGGSKRYPHSIVLASLGAKSAGVGYISLMPLGDTYEQVAARAPLTCIYDENIEKANAILFGNGVEENQENKLLLATLIAGLRDDQTLIVDATGLTLLALLNPIPHNGTILLTPHLGEAKRLFGLEGEANLDVCISAAREYAKTNGVHILLKNHESALVTKEGKTIRSFYKPTAALAKAGSGDVLAGLLGGLLARYRKSDMKFEELVSFGDWAFHYAMNRYQKRMGNACISAADFPKALQNLLLKGIILSRGNLPFFVNKD